MASNNDNPITPADQQAGILFRVEMEVTRLVLGYWKQGLGAISVVLLITLAIGLVDTHIRETQREISADIARVDMEIPEPDPLSMYGMAPMDNLDDTDRVEALKAAAEGYEAAANDASGPGEVEAWIKAADTWSRLHEYDKALEAFEKAHEEGADGLLGYTAGKRLATLYRDKGELEKAADVLRSLATSQEGLLAETALIEFISVQVDRGEVESARKAAAEFRVRFANSKRIDKVAALEAHATVAAGS